MVCSPKGGVGEAPATGSLKKRRRKKKKGRDKKKHSRDTALSAPAAAPAAPGVGVPPARVRGGAIAADEDGLPHHCTAGMERIAEPSVNHERSRKQVLCRNGFKKSKSVPIKYSPDGISMEQALAMGKRWVKRERARQGLSR